MKNENIIQTKRENNTNSQMSKQARGKKTKENFF
jgi:hypothetical protein